MIESIIAFAAARSVVLFLSGFFTSGELSGAVRLMADLVWLDGAAKSGFDILDFDTGEVC